MASLKNESLISDLGEPRYEPGCQQTELG